MAAQVDPIFLNKTGLLRWLKRETADDGIFTVNYLDDGADKIRQIAILQTDTIKEENNNNGVSDRSEEQEDNT